MPSVKVGSPNHAVTLLRYSYPIVLKLDNGDEVSLQRFYSDVMLLRTGLVVKSQRENVPPLPAKEFDGWSRVREQRRIAFAYFLNWCVLHAPADPLVLDFFQVKSLTYGDHVEIEPKRRLDKPEQQTFVKFLFFAFLWMLAWRAMLPKDHSISEETQNSTASAQEFIDFLVSPPSDAATFETVEVLVSKPEEIVVKTVHEEFIEFVGEHHFKIFSKEAHEVFSQGLEQSETVESQMIIDCQNDSEVETKTQDSVIDAPPVASIEIEMEHVESEEAKPTSDDEQPLISEKDDFQASISVDEPKTNQIVETHVIPEPVSDENPESSNEQQKIETAQDERGDIQSEFEAYVRDKTNRIEVETETHPQPIEFFFTPFHGMVGFLALYVIVLVWSRFVPSETSLAVASDDEHTSAELHPNSKSIFVSNEGGVVASSTDTSMNDSRVSNNGESSSSFASFSFDEARVIFDRLNDFGALNDNETNLGRALQFRALNLEPKGVQVLTRFWEEACALTCDQARERFVAFISSRFISTKARRRFLEQPSFSQLAQDVSDDNSSIASNGSAMAVFIKPPNSNGSSSAEATPTHNGDGSRAVSWWDASRQQLSSNNNVPTPITTPIKQQQGNGDLSFIKQEQSSSILTSFDSTDISSLSMSPSPVRAAAAPASDRQKSNRVVGSLVAPKMQENSDVESERAKSKQQEVAEVVVGTVVGIAGVALASQLIRAVRARRF